MSSAHKNIFLIHQAGDIVEIEPYLPQIEDFYITSFPDANEREDLESILFRIQSNSLENEPKSFLIIVIENENVKSCVFADWYSDSVFLHLTYLFVNPTIRNQGYARKMMTDYLPSSMRQIEQFYHITFDGYVLESNIPWLTETDSIDPSVRLYFFNSIGILWIPIEYSQPALDSTRDSVQTMFLLHRSLNNEKTLESAALKSFLFYFYLGLGIEDPKSTPPFVKMMLNIERLTMNNNTITLKTIPTNEENRLIIRKASICMHAVVEWVDPNKQLENSICPYFYSFEKDLFAYKYQRNSPFNTEFIETLDMKIDFPIAYEYSSEGTLFHKHCERKQINARLHINRSRFQSRKKDVFHFVISCDERDGFYENELIRFIHFFGSSQENSEVSSSIRFSTPQIKNVSFIELVSEITKLKSSLIDLSCGIVQIDTASIEFQSKHSVETLNWDKLYKNLKFESYTSANDEFNFERMYDNNEQHRYMLNLFCGLSLGIFDFMRMGYDEVLDTLIPIKVGEDFFISMNRGVLLKINRDDSMFDAAFQNIGMSPYILLPHMTLVYNEYILKTAEKTIDTMLLEIEQEANLSSSQLFSNRKDVDFLINFHYLTDVFQYPSEKELLIYGIQQRGIEDTRRELENQLAYIKSIIDQKEIERETNHELFMTILLTLISCFQVESIFESVANGDKVMSWVYTVVFSLTVTGTIYYFNKIKSKV
jgi:hypothetical protein